MNNKSIRVAIMSLFVAALLSGCMGGSATDDGTGPNTANLIGGFGGLQSSANDEIGSDDDTESTDTNEVADDDETADDEETETLTDITFVTTSFKKKATVGKTYNGDTIKVKGGSGTYVWELFGDLPAGLTCNKNPCNEAFDAKKVVLGGKPTEAGTFSFTVLVTDLEDDSISEEKDFSLVVKNASSSGSGSGSSSGISGGVSVGVIGNGFHLVTDGNGSGSKPADLKIALRGNAKSKLEIPLTSIDKTGKVAGSDAYYYPLEVTGGVPPYTWETRLSVNGGEIGIQDQSQNGIRNRASIFIKKLFAELQSPSKDPEVTITVTVRDSKNTFSEKTLTAVVVYPIEQPLNQFEVKYCRGAKIASCKEIGQDDVLNGVAFYHEQYMQTVTREGFTLGWINKNGDGGETPISYIDRIGIVGSPGDVNREELHDDEYSYVAIRSQYWEAVYIPSSPFRYSFTDEDITAEMKGYYGNDPLSVWKRLEEALPPLP